MECEHFYFSGHAVQRMFEKRIGKADVLLVISSGEVIAEYLDDKPFPSFLFLGFEGEQPLHVVAAVDQESQTCHIITVYRPDPTLWDEDFRHRRTK